MPISSMRTDAGFTLGPIPIPRRRQIANNLFRFASIKAGMRIVCCESSLEADGIYAKEGDPGVVWLCEQGLRIDRPIGKQPWYTFDLVYRTRDDNELLVAFKPTSELVPAADGSLKPPYWDAIEDACNDLGRRCSFVTEVDLAPKKFLIHNWRVLLPFAFAAYEDPDNELLANLTMLAGRGAGTTLLDLQGTEHTRDPEIVTEHVALLLHRGELSAPLAEAPFTQSTKLRRAPSES